MSKMLTVVVLFAVLFAVTVYAQPAGNAGTLEGAQVALVSQADLDAANARAAAAEQKLGVAGQQVAEERNQNATLSQQVADLREQIRQESEKATTAFSNGKVKKAAEHRQRRALLVVQLSRLEAGGAASKWARPQVDETLKAGTEGGLVGDLPKTNAGSKYWQKKPTNQQIAVAMARLRNFSANQAQNAITTHNDDKAAHPAIQEAIVGEAGIRETADNFLVAGVLLALIVGFIGWVLPKQRRERSGSATPIAPITPDPDYTGGRRREEPAYDEDDIDIPEFLRRRDPEPVAPAAAEEPASDAAVSEQPALPLDISLDDEGAEVPASAAEEQPAPQPASATEQPAYVRPVRPARRPGVRRPRGR